MALTRRELLKASAAAGALLVARPFGALATHLGPAPFGTSRTSRLFPEWSLAHADLHNHTLMSDGDGRTRDAFDSLRDAGLDVAALTDHATLGYDIPGLESCSECSSLLGINEAKWAEAGTIAEDEYTPGEFVSIRGFEWSSPTMGHMNVWFSEQWIDPLHTGGATTGEGVGQFMHDESGGRFPGTLSQPLDSFIKMSPTTGLSMQQFYTWLNSDKATPVLGGGSDGIAGFNHPGREVGRFGYFSFNPDVRDNIVSIEVFNRREDYLFEGTTSGVESPINQCLNAGWKVGLLGVTDEHGTDWGYPDGKGRTGLWVKDRTTEGVREAMLARRFFATRLKGLRVDAAANGIQMGQTVAHTSGLITFTLDIDRGEAWWGKRLNVQILQSGTVMPTVVGNIEVTVPRDDEPIISFSAPIDVANGNWIILRIADPDWAMHVMPPNHDHADDDDELEYPTPDGRASDLWRGFGAGIAYASPFFLDPDAPAASPPARKRTLL